MSQASRFLYPILNLAWGAGIGAAASIARAPGGCLDRPAVDCASRGRRGRDLRRRLRGYRDPARPATGAERRGHVAAAAASVLGLSTLAVSAPAWVLVWAAAALIGMVAGLLQPLRVRRRVAA